MNVGELNTILSRVEAGTADARDAERLREFICHIIDVAIARGEEIGYFETDDRWRLILHEVCGIDVLGPEELKRIQEMELTYG